MTVIASIRNLVYVAYADDAIGTGFTNTFDSGKDYIAILVSTTVIATPVVGDFTGLWKLYKGATGATANWITGAGAPSGGTGFDGDMYINESTGDVYGPKAAGAWGSAVADITGPQGPVGPDGSLFTENSATLNQALDFMSRTVYGPETLSSNASLTLGGVDAASANGKEIVWVFTLDPAVTLSVSADFYSEGGLLPGALTDSVEYVMRMKFISYGDGGGSADTRVSYTITANSAGT